MLLQVGESNILHGTLFRVGNATSGGENLHMVRHAFKIVVRYIRCEKNTYIRVLILGWKMFFF